MSSEPSDAEIIERVLDGDANVFELLVERYRDHVFGIVMKHVPAHEAENVAHEAFVRAYRALPSYRRESDVRRWLAAIAVRSSYDFWRERYRSREVPMSSLGEDEERRLETLSSAASARRADAEESSREARELLALALDRLSAEDRMVLELVHIEERPVREAAALLGWSAANVKVRAFRSRKRLRAILAKLLADREDGNEHSKHEDR